MHSLRQRSGTTNRAMSNRQRPDTSGHWRPIRTTTRSCIWPVCSRCSVASMRWRPGGCAPAWKTACNRQAPGSSWAGLTTAAANTLRQSAACARRCREIRAWSMRRSSWAWHWQNSRIGLQPSAPTRRRCPSTRPLWKRASILAMHCWRTGSQKLRSTASRPRCSTIQRMPGCCSISAVPCEPWVGVMRPLIGSTRRWNGMPTCSRPTSTSAIP